MRTVVCIKQVPETGHARWNTETNTIAREGVPSIVNPFDLYAVEEALRIRERLGGEVIVLTMGPPQAKEALLEIISMGADDAALLTDRAFAGSDTLATSRALAEGVRKIGAVNLVICGKQAVDGDTAQVGPELAQHLGCPFIAYVRKIEEIRADFIRAERTMEFGYEVVESCLPVVISVVREINEARLPSLKGKIRAKSFQVKMWSADDLGVDKSFVGMPGSPTQVVRAFNPPPRGKGETLQGDADHLAAELHARLKNLKLV